MTVIVKKKEKSRREKEEFFYSTNYGYPVNKDIFCIDINMKIIKSSSLNNANINSIYKRKGVFISMLSNYVLYCMYYDKTGFYLLIITAYTKCINYT